MKESKHLVNFFDKSLEILLIQYPNHKIKYHGNIQILKYNMFRGYLVESLED